MNTSLLNCLAAMGVSLLCNWAALRLARRVGLVDRPDGQRKLQREPVPLAGGLAIAAATGGMVAALMIVDPERRETAHSYVKEAVGLLAGWALILVLGVLDDFGRLRGRQKLAGQIAAAFVVACCGVCIHRIQIFQWSVELGLLAVPFTVFWLVGAMNDGLSS